MPQEYAASIKLLNPRRKPTGKVFYVLIGLLWLGLALGLTPAWAVCGSYFVAAGLSFVNGQQAPTASNSNYNYYQYCMTFSTTAGTYVNLTAIDWTIITQSAQFKQSWTCTYNGRTDVYFPLNCSWQSNITAFWATPPVPGCTLSANPATITAGESSTLTAVCTNSPTSYSWTNSGFANSATSGSVSPTTTTTYSVHGVNGTGAGSDASVTVTVNPAKPTCSLAANPSTISLGDSSTLTSTCTPTPSSYTWTNSGFSSSVSSGSVSPTATTTYSVAGIDTSGTGAAASATVTVNPLVDATSRTQVNASALSLNRATGKYGGTITVTNTGSTTITGPLYVFFTLPTGVTLPTLPTYGGLPYLRFDLQGGLAPGAATGPAVVTFTDPTNARIAYTTTRSAISY